ncbi:Rhodanese-like domain-containing protein [Amylocarpus encephaloides]|uniref:Rhodanese-like domain-containing protein n=1 Tax=Amylocarpus encephaloides TaxID=45428 RepID=A0A9P7YB90_9HELO|nr:Rhodanese-like domain-containing protein [Amylocarpus encephaloides]
MTRKGLLFNTKPSHRIASYRSRFSSSAIMATINPSVGEPAADKPWHAAYPAPKTTAAVITRESLLSWMLDGKVAGKDFVLVDLRRTDFEGGTIRGSINLPAQSLYSTIPSLYALLSTAAVRNVIWYCGSSRGRGNRAAGWFADYIKEQNNTEMESRTLEEGIKGWATGGDEYVRMMDEYDAAIWK